MSIFKDTSQLGIIMPKGSAQLTASRKDEIVKALETLYQTMNFKDITLKEIADLTSFTRTSIYNYFQTKEEIFLTLHKIEYERWIEDLEKIINSYDSMSRDDIAKKIARTLGKREQLLKLMSMNHFEMESNSRLEILTEFKISYGNSIKTVEKLIKKFCPEMKKAEINDFIYALFPFIYGIYPYVAVDEKQKEAMKIAKTGFIYHSIYELAYNAIRKMLC